MHWTLSGKGWLLLLLLILSAAVGILLNIHPFLAVNDPIATKTMVVEGWIGQTELIQVVDEFNRGGYDRVFTTGGPVHGVKKYVNDYSTSAHIAAQNLIQLGLPSEVVRSVPSHEHARDRTFSAASALLDWFRENQAAVPDFVVVTQSVHARRSRLLFEMAFGDEPKIGVVSLQNPDYDAKHWWRYSEGVKAVISEGAAYLYARLLFSPEPIH